MGTPTQREPIREVEKEFVFFGQQTAKTQIAPFLHTTDKFPNTLILGMPGVGKTRLAQWIARERFDTFEEMLCPIDPNDLPRTGVVLLDECHRQRKPEWLFPSMASLLTVIGATTKPEMLDPAFKSRFILTLHLERYDHASMMDMARHLMSMSEESADLYASASAGNPRQLELLVRIAESVGAENHEQVLSAAQITAEGLTLYHLKVLAALNKASRPLGLTSLANMLYSDESSVRDHEQILVEYGLVDLRTNGRAISREGKEYLKQRQGLLEQ